MGVINMVDIGRADCAHLKVGYCTITDPTGITRGWWECPLCHIEFRPLANTVKWAQKINPPKPLTTSIKSDIMKGHLKQLNL